MHCHFYFATHRLHTPLFPHLHHLPATPTESVVVVASVVVMTGSEAKVCHIALLMLAPHAILSIYALAYLACTAYCTVTPATLYTIYILRRSDAMTMKRRKLMPPAAQHVVADAVCIFAAAVTGSYLGASSYRNVDDANGVNASCAWHQASLVSEQRPERRRQRAVCRVASPIAYRRVVACADKWRIIMTNMLLVVAWRA